MPFINTDAVEKEILPGASARFVHSGHMTLSLWRFKAGTALPEHSHPHEQMTKLLSGQFELTVGDETKMMTKSDVAVIPPHVLHKGVAVTDCEMLDVFSPERDDYK